MLGFVAQNQTNISANSLRVAIVKPSRKVLGPAALYIRFLDWVHFQTSLFLHQRVGCCHRRAVDPPNRILLRLSKQRLRRIAE